MTNRTQFNWKPILRLAILIALPWNTFASNPKGWIANLDQGEGSIEFVAVGKPKAIKIIGKGAAPKGQLRWDLGKGSGKVTFAMGSLDTGIKLRSDHMKKYYLETEKYPEAVLQLSSVSLPSTKAQGDFSLENIPFMAQLSLHGITKPIKGTATIKRDGTNLEIESEFEIKITDFKIKVPEYMGITVADEVQIQVHSKSPISTRP
jgi:polyisoprenoid-binding protein YceI